MKLKYIPEDFIVDEIYNLKDFEKRDEERKFPYYYFKLTKTNYSQIRALELVAKIFNTSRKLVHFAGTKDKSGITSQLISVYGINPKTFESNMKFFNEKKDLKIEFLKQLKGRINLGDNKGNAFVVTIRDLEDDLIQLAQQNIKRIEEKGVLNFFDEQRFGYANNSHIVGKYIFQNKIEDAVKEILTSLPPNPKDEIQNFVKLVKENWQEICDSNRDKINEIIQIAPRFMRGEIKVLQHLRKFKGDFPGALRTIHKKLRMLYVCAYQSYIFNETLKNFKEKNDVIQKLENGKIALASSNFKNLVPKKIYEFTKELIKKDNLNFEDFVLKHMPELTIDEVYRSIFIHPKNIKIKQIDDDELFENKQKIVLSFELESGAYATNVIKDIFNKL